MMNALHVFNIFNINRYSPPVQRFIIVLSACLVRVPLIFIFFGSADMRNEIPITKLIFAHTQGALHLPYPYIPLAAMFSWAAGVLTIYTSLPLSFCYKLIPIFFDILLTLLVYDIFRRSKPELAAKIGLLYALAPIPLIINCIHFQWDSIVLFFLVISFYVRDYFNDSLLKYFMFGLLFALSFLFKPYTLAFAFFFFTPFKGLSQKLGHIWCVAKFGASLLVTAAITLYVICRLTRFSFEKAFVHFSGHIHLLIVALIIFSLIVFAVLSYSYMKSSEDLKIYFKFQFMALAGMLVTVVIALSILHLLGFNVLAGIDHLLRYANKGTPQFGLPFAYPFMLKPLRLWLENRMWLLIVTAFISYFYYNEQIDAFTGIFLSFMVMMGLSGLYAPYLQWPLVFFLLAGFFRLCAVYNLLVTCFLLLFYCNPYSNYAFPYESMLSFAALKSFAWLMPPNFLSDYSFIPVLALLSNYVIPIFSLGTVWYGLQLATNKTLIFLRKQKKNFLLTRNGYLIANICLFLIIIVVWRLVDTRGFDSVLNDVTVQKMLWYHTYRLSPFGNIATAFFPDWSWLNIIFLFFAGALAWSWTVWPSKHRNS